MPPELGFSELRTVVEENTYIPEFQEIQRRARRHKRRRRLVTVAKFLGIFAFAVPGVIVGTATLAHEYLAPNPPAAGKADAINGPQILPLFTPTTRTVVAVDGADVRHLYALIDVCRSGDCDLQLARFDPSGVATGTVLTGLLRQKSTDIITDEHLSILDTDTVVVSAVNRDGSREYSTVPMTGHKLDIGFGERPVQQTLGGAVLVSSGAPDPLAASSASASSTTGGGTDDVSPATLVPAATQPALSVPILASQVNGWWVWGWLPDSNQLGVAVSEDKGRTWTTRSLGIGTAPDATVSVAAADKQNVYVLVRLPGHISIERSHDGGRTWDPIAVTQSWPQSTRAGIIVRPDGTLVAWFAKDSSEMPAMRYMRSVDGGATFTPESGASMPGGILQDFDGGYLSLGTSPAVSSDGARWISMYVPFKAPSIRN